MSEEREIDLRPGEYRQAFNGPLANPKYLRWSLAVFLAAALGGSLFCGLVVPQLWWLQLFVIPIAMYAGAALAGLWPNFFFGSDPNKDNFT